jgi:hypothetical protein
MFVIGRQGDTVSLLFPATNLTAPADGMERDFFLFVSLWFKDETGNWGYGFDFTVEPIPFHNMSGFPYPLDTESYPNDTTHLNYLQQYNTRLIIPSSHMEASYFTTWIIAVITILTITDLGILFYFKKRDRFFFT